MDLSFLKNLFKKKESSVLGLDVGASSIKIVQLRKRHGKAVLETYGEIALGPYDGKEAGQATNLPAEKIVGVLKDLITESKITSHTGGVAIPYVSSLVTLIELPDADQKQLEQMVPLEARKYIPVPISEVLFDWSIVPKQAQSISTPTQTPANQNEIKKIEVMVVAIHNETINKFQEIGTKTGLTTSFYEIEMFSSLRSLLPPNASATILMDFGAGSTKIYIIEQGLIRVSHLIRHGGQDITAAISKTLSVSFAEAETLKKNTDPSLLASQKEVGAIMTTHLDTIFAETKQVLASYEHKYGKTITHGVLIGGGALMKGIVPFAKNKLGIEVVAGDPFTYVESPAFLTEILKTKNPEFSVAVGLALRMLQDS